MREPRNYDALRDSERQGEELRQQDEAKRTAEREEQARAAEEAQRLEASGAGRSIDDTADRMAAKEAELQERYQAGRISRLEMAYELRQFDANLVNEMRTEDRERLAGKADAKSQETEREQPGQERTDSNQARMDRLLGGRGSEEPDLALDRDNDRGGRTL